MTERIREFPTLVTRILGSTLSSCNLRQVAWEHRPNLFDTVTWESQVVRVQIELDLHDAALSVTIAALDAPSEEFPLWLVLWATGGSEAEARRLDELTHGEGQTDWDCAEAALIRAAPVLAGAASPLLSGDFSLVPSLRRANQLRIEANVRHEPWPNLKTM